MDSLAFYHLLGFFSLMDVANELYIQILTMGPSMRKPCLDGQDSFPTPNQHI